MRLSTGCALIDPKAVLAEAGLASGMTYADFGAGTLGHFAFPAAAAVGPKGRVYAVDILKGALAGIESRLKLEGTQNLFPVWGDFERPNGAGIKDGIADLVSVVNIASVLTKGPGALREARRVLKPGGTLLVADWDARGSDAFGPPSARRSDPAQVIAAAASAGFARGKAFRAGPHHWGLTFVRP